MQRVSKPKSLLQSFKDEICGLIRRNEGQFAQLVIDDFNDALRDSRKPISTARYWLKTYRSYTY